MNKLNLIDGFQGEYRWLSNFWIHDTHRGISVEHLYQAAKTTNLEDYMLIMSAETPGDAKRYGKIVNVRSDWSEVRVTLMEQFTREKYATNATLREKLLATKGMYIQESNTWGDIFWGVCGGQGENKLGQILMNVRDKFCAI